MTPGISRTAVPTKGSIAIPRPRDQHARIRLAPLLALVAALPACLCPPRAEDLLATGFRTPRQTFESFKTFLRADLPMQEYLCFSAGFRQRNALSAATYAEAREQLFDDQPWIRLVAKAEVAGERAVGADEHWFDAEVLGRTVRVKLVREAFFEIFASDQLVADDYAPFGELVEVRREGREAVLTARIPFEASAGELAELSELQVARHWRIDDLRELGDDDERLPPPDPGRADATHSTPPAPPT
jgi:hypothetical protein